MRNFWQKASKFCSKFGELWKLSKKVRIWLTHGEGWRCLGSVMRSERSEKGWTHSGGGGRELVNTHRGFGLKCVFELGFVRVGGW